MQLDTWTITGKGFHFGKHGLGQEETMIHLPSDSLFAALTARLAALKGSQAVAEWMQPFCDGAPPFVLSSAFPFAKSVRFFPAPARQGAEPGGALRAKDIKNIRFVSEQTFRLLLQGKALTKVIPEGWQPSPLLWQAQETGELPEAIRLGKTPLWVEEKQPRVALGRMVQNSNLFHTGRVSYAEGCGLWFAVRWLHPDTARQALLQTLLADLGDAGLGGERSVGYGTCAIRPSETLDLPEDPGQPWVSLSRYLPRPDEIHALQDARAAYHLARVGGWLQSPARSGQRRRSLNLLAEGAVLGPLPRTVPGQVVDVRPRYKADLDPLGHPVYRSGLALAVPILGGEA